MYYALIGILFFVGFAMMVQNGIWNNLISLFSIVIAGLVAYGVHQPLVVMADESTGGSYTYLLDFPILWGVFGLTVGLLNFLANAFSRNRVNFPEQVDGYGGAAVAAIGAYFLVAFSMSTMHVAPLSYDTAGGAYEYGVTPKKVESSFAEASSLMKPDLAWLRITESVLSQEAFGDAGFSAKIFVSEHGQHRKKFQEIKETIVKRS